MRWDHKKCLQHLFEVCLNGSASKLTEKRETYTSIDEFVESFVPLLECEAVESFQLGQVKMKGALNVSIDILEAPAKYIKVTHNNRGKSPIMMGDILIFSSHSISTFSKENISIYTLAVIEGMEKESLDPDSPTFYKFYMDSEALENLNREQVKFASVITNIFSFSRILLRIKSNELNKGVTQNIKNRICNLSGGSQTKITDISDDDINHIIENCPLSERLNSFQLLTLRNCLQDVNQKKISAVMGPPGTGKTTWIIGFLYCLIFSNPGKTFLQCASTNVAMAEVARRALPHLQELGVNFWIVGREEKLIDEGILSPELYDHFLPWRLGRIYAEIKVLLSVIDMIREGITYECVQNISNFLKENDCARYKASVAYNKEDLESMSNFLEESILNMINSIRKVFEMSGRRNIIQICGKIYVNVLRGEYDEAFVNTQDLQISYPGDLEMKTSLLKSARLIFSTVNGMIQRSIIFSDTSYHAIIVDEAAQVLEVESTAFIISKAESIIMVGDHRQLEGTLHSEDAKVQGYGESLFERLLRQGLPFHNLKVQYRMNPIISKFPSWKFYDGELEDSDSVRTLKKPWHSCSGLGPLAFYQHNGTVEETRHNSKVNDSEVKYIFSHLARFLAYCSAEGIDTFNLTIGVICPYSSQRDSFRDKFPIFHGSLKKLNLDPKSTYKSIDFNTVDGFQGQERDIIILSLTRANPNAVIGFVKNEKRMNVALTRAKYNLWIFGDERTFAASHERIGHWHSLFSHCKTQNLIFSYKDIPFKLSNKKIDEHWQVLEESNLISRGDLKTVLEAKVVDNCAIWRLIMLDTFRKQISDGVAQDKPLSWSLIDLVKRLLAGKFSEKCDLPYGKNDSVGIIDGFHYGSLFWASPLTNNFRLLWDIQIRKNTQVIVLKKIVNASELQKEFSQFYSSKSKLNRRDLENLVPTIDSEGISLPISGIEHSNLEEVPDYRDQRGSVIKTFDFDLPTLSRLIEGKSDGFELPYLLDDVQEKASNAHQQFSLIVGRSGCGKTSVMTNKAFAIFKSIVTEDMNLENVPSLLFLTQSAFLVKEIQSQFRNLCHSFIQMNNLPMNLLLNFEKSFKFVSFMDLLTHLDEILKTGLFFRSEDSAIATNIGRKKTKGEVAEKMIPKNHISFLIFENMYYKTISKDLQKKFSPRVIFSEIMTFIKGSEGMRVLGKDEYVSLAIEAPKRVNQLIQDPVDRSNIYDFFKSYETLKAQRKEFDLPDLILKLHSMLVKPVEESGFHYNYMLVDEVQDLLPIQVAFLSKLINPQQSIVAFCGDLAQAITEGNMFKFSRVKDIFFAELKSKLETCALLKNYRSPATIVNLANTITRWIKVFFRNELDQLPEEQSSQQGVFKPLVLAELLNDKELLGFLFKNDCNEMGADQCIIVRNKNTRDYLHQFFKSNRVSANILTILESKGLEFEDVVIYNIFSDSTSSRGFRILMNVEPERFSHENLPVFDPKKHNSLCQDLKELYVAVTRAKNRVVFYDEDKSLLKVFSDVAGDAVSISNEKSHEDLSFAIKGSADDWDNRGNQYFNNGLYEYAMDAFAKAHNDKMLCLSKASHLKEKFEIVGMDGSNSNRGKELARESGELFKQVDNYKEAGEIYKKGCFWEEAASCFLSLKNHLQYLDCLLKGEHYEKAFNFVISNEKLEGFSDEALDRVLVEIGGVYLNQKSKLNQLLKRIVDFEVGKTFLLENKLDGVLFDFCKKRSKYYDAAQVALELGKYDEGLKLMDLVEDNQGSSDKYQLMSNLFAKSIFSSFSIKNPQEIDFKIPANSNLQFTNEKRFILDIIKDHSKVDILSEYFSVKFLSLHLKTVNLFEKADKCFQSMANMIKIMHAYFSTIIDVMKILENGLDSEKCRNFVELFFGFVGRDCQNHNVILVKGWFQELSSTSCQDVMYLTCIKNYLLKHWFSLSSQFSILYKAVDIRATQYVRWLSFENSLVTFKQADDFWQFVSLIYSKSTLLCHKSVQKYLQNMDTESKIIKEYDSLLSESKQRSGVLDSLYRYVSWGVNYPYSFENMMEKLYCNDGKMKESIIRYKDFRRKCSTTGENQYFPFPKFMEEKIKLVWNMYEIAYSPLDYMDLMQEIIIQSCVLFGRPFHMSSIQLNCFVAPWFPILKKASEISWIGNWIRYYSKKIEDIIFKFLRDSEFDDVQSFKECPCLKDLGQNILPKIKQYFLIMLLTILSYFELDAARKSYYDKALSAYIGRVVNLIKKYALPITEFEEIDVYEMSFEAIRIKCLNALGADDLLFQGFGKFKVTTEIVHKFSEVFDQSPVIGFEFSLPKNYQVPNFIRDRLNYLQLRARIRLLDVKTMSFSPESILMQHFGVENKELWESLLPCLETVEKTIEALYNAQKRSFIDGAEPIQDYSERITNLGKGVVEKIQSLNEPFDTTSIRKTCLDLIENALSGQKHVDTLSLTSSLLLMDLEEEENAILSEEKSSKVFESANGGKQIVKEIHKCYNSLRNAWKQLFTEQKERIQKNQPLVDGFSNHLSALKVLFEKMTKTVDPTSHMEVNEFMASMKKEFDQISSLGKISLNFNLGSRRDNRKDKKRQNNPQKRDKTTPQKRDKTTQKFKN